MKTGKRYAEAMKNVDRAALYDVADAISIVKKNASAKFDETVELHIRTGCDGRHADQQIRGAVVVPVQGGDGFLDGVDEGTALDGLTLSIVRPAGLLAAGRKAQQHQSGENEANDFGKLFHVFSPLVILMIIMYRSPLPGDLSDEHVFLQPIHGNDDLLHGQGQIHADVVRPVEGTAVLPHNAHLVAGLFHLVQGAGL